MSHYDIIIIGSGVSGLAAAIKLKNEEKKTNFLMLEAREVQGGRVYTKTTSNGNLIDLGVN